MSNSFTNRGVDEPVDEEYKPRPFLPDTTSGLQYLPDGSWHEIHRPLATGLGSIPRRGNEGHGTDDADNGKFYPYEDGDVAPLQDAPGDEGKSDFADVRWDGVPLFVTQVPHPMRAVVRNVLTRTIFTGTENPSGAVGRPDTSSVVAIPRDPGRDRVYVSLDSNVAITPQTLSTRFAVAVSHNGSFADGTYLMLASTGNKHSFVTTEPLYFAMVPLLPYDGTLNSFRLHVVQEFSTTIDRNVSER